MTSGKNYQVTVADENGEALRWLYTARRRLSMLIEIEESQRREGQGAG